MSNDNTTQLGLLPSFVKPAAGESSMACLTPREIVSELDKYIIGQKEAKRMVAIAMRNRWRRRRLDPAMREEVAPKNIIMMGPTGVGKTEIARRLANLVRSPFFKVEATKFTEVGYVGRDVESMIRDLMEISVNLVKKEESRKVTSQAEQRAEDILLDALLPNLNPEDASSTRDKFRRMLREGKLDEREVEVEVADNAGPNIEVMTMPGMEDMGSQISDMFGKMFPEKRKKRKMTVKDAREALVQDESERLIDMEKVIDEARDRVEESGILFIDEIDKICQSERKGGGGEVSREGVQRDLLPIVEGCVVKTKHGMVKTDHILFIAAGAFHLAKPSDLIPELQGRFPLRVELTDLGADEFYRILTEPENALTKQYTALLGTEGVEVAFTDDGLREIAAFAEKVNNETENIGARRLYTMLERILSDLSFDAPEKRGETVEIDANYVREKLEDVVEDRDLTRYVL